jgi:hypothetical protein
MCLVSFQFGFDYGIVNTLQASTSFLRVFGYPDPTLALGYGIDSTTQQLLSSLLSVGTLVAGIFTGYIGNRLGRRTALRIGCVTTIIALVIMTAALNINAIYVARVLMGMYFILLTDTRVWKLIAYLLCNPLDKRMLSGRPSRYRHCTISIRLIGRRTCFSCHKQLFIQNSISSRVSTSRRRPSYHPIPFIPRTILAPGYTSTALIQERCPRGSGFSAPLERASHCNARLD